MRNKSVSIVHRVVPNRMIFVGFLLAAFALLLLPAIIGVSKPLSNVGEISLKPAKLPFTPKEFYIADIVDKRTDRSAVAWVVPSTSAGQKTSGLQKVDLKGGGAVAIKQFVAQSMPANKELRPIVVYLNELTVKEKAGAQSYQVDGQVSVVMSFYLKRNGENIHLLDYKGGAKYGRSINQQEVIESVLRQALGNSFKYLNTWIDKEAYKNEKLATGIKITFSEPDHVEAEDTVYYSLKRPLNWNDFKATPNGKSEYAASVFPGFGYKGSSKVEGGIIHLNLTLEVFMLQQSSWVKDVARNPYALNHEQRHFDIVRIVADSFKKRIQPDSLTIEDYNSIIQYQYIEAFRDMNRMQEKYDGETRHGIDRAAQERWNAKIEGELKKISASK